MIAIKLGLLKHLQERYRSREHLLAHHPILEFLFLPVVAIIVLNQKV